MGIIVLSFLVTAALVFAGLFLLFRKYSSGKNPFSNVYYWLTAMVAIPCFYIGVIFIWLFASSSYERKAFDKENWAENRDTRYEYVDDLVDGEKLIGLSNSELKIMLGETDQEDDSTMVFYIGYSPQHFFNMDPDWLEAKFTDGKVSNVFIRE